MPRDSADAIARRRAQAADQGVADNRWLSWADVIGGRGRIDMRGPAARHDHRRIRAVDPHYPWRSRRSLAGWGAFGPAARRNHRGNLPPAFS
ncbi:hypothetical protein [Nocardia sp. NPDC052112]|uniref:hypothetical protein n=1 Tax=Nocardia sp. NPDC052112 TaxID=3155646 RepID=UPI00342A026F